ncbi:MAG: ABC transporter permease [Anaerolineaceae bacterium]|nr:ABC transporter permease [Anaerolineaceae bacterium]
MRRLNYILLRLLQMIPVVFGITLALFFLIRAIPGDPAVIRLGIRATPEGVANLHRIMGLDKPIWVQYGIFMRDVFTLNLGDSIMYQTPVTGLLARRLPITLFLAAYATLLSIILTVPMAMWAAMKKDTITDTAIRGGFMLALGMPEFWVGIILLIIFGVKLKLFPVSGFGDTFLEHLRHLALPAFTLALHQSSWMIRSLRSDIINVLRADYVDFARAKGLRERFVLTRHILRNAMIPTVTILGVNIGYLVGGAVIVERVFSIPGLGNLMLDSIFSRDYTVVQAVTLYFSAMIILINLITDLAYSVLDPRVTLE